MAVELTGEQIHQLLQGISIPPQPQIMVDLQMEQLSPHCSIQRVAELISQDVGLSGSILKTVNSAFFGLSNKITSVKQACHLLGSSSVVNIVNALSIRGELSDEDIIELGNFWDNATDVAMACATVAKQIGAQAPDEAYTLGLLHNCGMALLMHRFDNYLEVVRDAYARVEPRIIDLENERFHTNHAVVGYYVAKSWNLPRHICEAIHDHHSAEPIFADFDYPDTAKKNLLAVLKIAEHICGNHTTLGKQQQDHEWQRLQSNLLIYVGLSEYDFQLLKDAFEDMGLGRGGTLYL